MTKAKVHVEDRVMYHGKQKSILIEYWGKKHRFKWMFPTVVSKSFEEYLMKYHEKEFEVLDEL